MILSPSQVLKLLQVCYVSMFWSKGGQACTLNLCRQNFVVLVLGYCWQLYYLFYPDIKIFLIYKYGQIRLIQSKKFCYASQSEVFKLLNLFYVSIFWTKTGHACTMNLCRQNVVVIVCQCCCHLYNTFYPDIKYYWFTIKLDRFT